jgi:hypothetical protein
MSSKITCVTTLDLNGLPIEPAEARKAFKCACEFQVRDNISITIQDWGLMPEATNEQLWKNITEKIKYPDDVDEELVKHATLISMGKPEMNRKYVKKQLVPKHMGNIYPHHLGSSGYVGKVFEWKKKLEETVTAGKPNPLESVEERTQRWILARSNLTEDGTLVYKKKQVAKVQQKALQVAAK